MIVLWGIPADDPLAAVRHELEEARKHVVLIDQRQLAKWRVDGLDGGDGFPRRIALDGRAVEFAEVSGAYVRPYDRRRIPSVRQDTAVAQSELIEQTLTLWSEVTTATVVNRPSAMASNNSKPYQLQLIRSYGFSVPETLVTTDPLAVESFWEECGSLVYKSVSGIRSVVSRLREVDRWRLAEVANCPTQFQQYISGVDVRVHVVGHKTFACEIRSDADDYRYPQTNSHPEVVGIGLSLEQQRSCCGLAHALDLQVAGIDFRVSGAGVWYCLEVNPSPGFTFYEALTGQPIAKAIAQLLAS